MTSMERSGGVIAIIPARAGSRRLGGKNLAPLAGRPMAAWTIDAALSSSRVDRVVVSTDDPDVARVAESMGIPVPKLRPAHLSGDDVPPQEVLTHVLESQASALPAVVLLLQPTSPLRLPRDIDTALSLLEPPEIDSVVSACRWEEGRWGVAVDGRQLLLGNGPHRIPDSISAEDQHPIAAPATLSGRLNGAIFAARTEFFLRTGTFYGGCTKIYWMPPERSVDVDTADDLAWAQRLLSARRSVAGSGD